MVFEPVDYDYFRGLGYFHDGNVYTDHSPNGEIIPAPLFLDACRWIRNNSDISDAFFHPTYIREFRVCSQRQGFLAVKSDGNLAAVDRRFGAVYLKRFMDIHQGYTEKDLPELAKDKSRAYRLLREKYLSLSKSEIELLRQKYPGYNFLLTESTHQLPYSILYQNGLFVI